MLAKRRLVLSSSAVLVTDILRREDLAGTVLAAEVLDNARIEAEQILAAAHAQAQHEKDQALAQFWDSANGFLQQLEQQRLALAEESMEAVEALLNEALAELLDQTSLAERSRALMRNLAAGQTVETRAVLSAHPAMLDSLGEWLSASRFTDHWQLKGDPTLAPQTLRLSDANGAFDIDWDSLRRGLVGQSAHT
ncbi:type III secretion system stator protein SctL [Pseudomonas petrae]|uniref:Type III secretion system stator protein SctL n=1 Tax=Pseudomonas petrae TaxID=2912190 RepID=A0ABS9I7M2_9PSED|nr:type III secretion system stator protein SctL [Pseudomonas petrae]MCF7534246.1 type III secretion system stator protein SctL [Pseudomonas petrae]MCF7539712.1 type III secretion system stator protein SctL [Pseudomonas petrae]MCF7543036.1 type III secretion system stator protein SctL [Pseudomonas petrae]MCF7558000.1 type III secretion system stator protein SctL [Pseudomonas petrae]